MKDHDIIVIGASAGGVEALAQLASGLPADLPASLFVVHHFPIHSTSVLPNILSRAGVIAAAHAVDGEAILPGRIYVAPPNCHLLLRRGHVHLARGARENGHRPAVDPLFRTAALAYGRRVIGVVLTGSLDDGTAGLQAVKERGGIAVVQDPADALYAGMPTSAIENVSVDHVVPLAQIAPLLTRLVLEPVETRGDTQVSNEMETEAGFAELDLAAVEEEPHPGEPSTFGCPECGGVLWELREGELFRFRCRVGHAYSADTLIAEQSEALEAALWTALRALEEKASLTQRLIDRARHRGSTVAARRFALQVEESREHAKVIRRVLLAGLAGEPLSSSEKTPVSKGQSRGGGHPPGDG